MCAIIKSESESAKKSGYLHPEAESLRPRDLCVYTATALWLDVLCFMSFLFIYYIYIRTI